MIIQITINHHNLTLINVVNVEANTAFSKTRLSRLIWNFIQFGRAARRDHTSLTFSEPETNLFRQLMRDVGQFNLESFPAGKSKLFLKPLDKIPALVL